MEDAGVVAKQVDGAEALVREGREGVDLLGTGHVGGRHDDLGAGGLDLGRRLLERVDLDVGDDDAHALAGGAAGERAPDPAPRARDHRDPTFELLHATTEECRGRRSRR